MFDVEDAMPSAVLATKPRRAPPTADLHSWGMTVVAWNRGRRQDGVRVKIDTG